MTATVLTLVQAQPAQGNWTYEDNYSSFEGTLPQCDFRLNSKP